MHLGEIVSGSENNDSNQGNKSHQCAILSAWNNRSTDDLEMPSTMGQEQAAVSANQLLTRRETIGVHAAVQES